MTGLRSMTLYFHFAFVARLVRPMWNTAQMPSSSRHLIEIAIPERTVENLNRCPRLNGKGTKFFDDDGSVGGSDGIDVWGISGSIHLVCVCVYWLLWVIVHMFPFVVPILVC